MLKLDARYGGEFMRQTFLQKVPSRRRRHGESLHALAEDICRMCRVVYNDIPVARSKKLVINHFAMAFNDAQCQWELSKHSFDSLEEAGHYTQNRESFF